VNAVPVDEGASRDTAHGDRPAAARASTVDGAAIVVGDPGPDRDRLVTELVVFGYRPLLADAGVPLADRQPALGIVVAVDGADPATLSSELRGPEELRNLPLVWLLPPGGAASLEGQEHLCDDFLELPYEAPELFARLRLLRWRTGREGPDVIRRGPLSLNISTYQALLEGRPLNLTSMEYELLKLLIGEPGRVFTREAILGRVWRYDYYGGLRTVDVHVRRVRAKLGQDHAWLIETVRGVGYRFAQQA